MHILVRCSIHQCVCRCVYSKSRTAPSLLIAMRLDGFFIKILSRPIFNQKPNAKWWKIRRRIFLQLKCKEFNAQPPKREFFTSALHTQSIFSIRLFVYVCDCGIFEKLERVTMVMLIIRSDMWEMCQCSRLHRSERVCVCVSVWEEVKLKAVWLHAACSVEVLQPRRPW